MTDAYVDKNEVVAALKATAPEVVAATRAIKDPKAIAIGEWSASDVAAHLIDVMEAAVGIVQGQGTPFTGSGDVAGNNEARLAGRPNRDPAVLADGLEKAYGDYIATLEGIDDDPMIPWASLKVPVSAAASVELAESLIHGYDIARSQGRPWTIDPARAVLSSRGISPMVESYVDEEAARDFSATFDVRFRGYSALHYVFDNGTLTIEEPGSRKADVHISAEPVAFMLVGYGRISQWGPIAMGKLITWGRKPWLAFKFATLLKQP